MVQLELLGQLKNLVTSLGIEPASFRHVATTLQSAPGKTKYQLKKEYALIKFKNNLELVSTKFYDK
jgi:hypothetical protein